jgi:anaerobic selenocysteine-containing dehydrogenase
MPTVLLEDFEKTDAIFVIGQNPGTNSPRCWAGKYLMHLFAA